MPAGAGDAAVRGARVDGEAPDVAGLLRDARHPPGSADRVQFAAQSPNSRGRFHALPDRIHGAARGGLCWPLARTAAAQVDRPPLLQPLHLADGVSGPPWSAARNATSISA